MDAPLLRRGRQVLGGLDVQLNQKRPLPLSKRKARSRDAATELDGIYWRAAVAGRMLRRVTQFRNR